jgi:putative Holliday junction resolvase
MRAYSREIAGSKKSMEDNPKLITGRLLGLDLGDKRIGVAVTDELQVSISPLPPIAVTNWKAVLEAIRHVIAEFDAAAVVIGWPLNMDGTEGPCLEKVRATAAKLQKSVALPIFFQDERLTTEGAMAILSETRVPPEARKSMVDSRAAAIILSDYISRASNI